MVDTPAQPRRPSFRYSLRTMFVVVTVFALWLGWELNSFGIARPCVNRLLERGGAVQLQYTIPISALI